MLEKRRAKRFDLSLPVLIEHENGYFHLSRTKNVAEGGAQVMMDVPLNVGEPIKMTYDINVAKNLEFGVMGKVVRVEKNHGTEKRAWPFVMAVEFSEIQPALTARLMTLELTIDVFA